MVPIIKSPAEFFNGLIEQNLANKNRTLDEYLKFYLVSLLLENVDPENLLKKNEKHPYADDPIALIFQRSFLEPTNKRRQMLKYVGDYSLYVAGFFRESLNRKILQHIENNRPHTLTSAFSC